MKYVAFLVWALVLLFVVLLFTKQVREESFDNSGALVQLASTEAFGMSPGTMDQLDSTRVVSEKEQKIDEHIYNNLTRQGIMNMTESGYNGSEYASAFRDY
jgi:hypothetical protein